MTKDERCELAWRSSKSIYRNSPEDTFVQLARSYQWQPIKKGWPDFVVRSLVDGEIIAVEVKPVRRKGDRLMSLTKEQGEVMQWLCGLGVRCYVTDGTKERFEPFDYEQHVYGRVRLTQRHRMRRVA